MSPSPSSSWKNNSGLILATLLHGTQAVGISQTLQYGIFMQQGGHPIRQWAIELSSYVLIFLLPK